MDKAIKHVHFQLTRNCNLRCSFCGQWGKKGFFADSSGEEMTLSDWNRIICELEEYRDKTGISPVVTLWGGEPLVSPYFDEIAKRLKQKGFKTELITNGTKIDEHKDVIEFCIDRLYVSIDGTADIHNSIRGQGVFEKVRENLIALNHNNITVMSVITPRLIENLKEFLDELKGLKIHDLFLQDMIGLKKDEVTEYKIWLKSSFDIDAKEIDSWEADEKINFSHELTQKLNGIDEADYPFAITHKQHTDNPEIICKSPFNHAHIAWNGNVLFCTDFYDFSAGNVKEKTLESVFLNEKSEKFRTEIVENRCSTCKHCSWRTPS